MLANKVHIGVLSKFLGHSNIQTTIESYSSIIDQMVLNNVNMAREKLKSAGAVHW